MSKFINIVKVQLIKDSKENYLEKTKNIVNFDGLISCKHVEIGFKTFYMIEEWTSKEALMKARKMIEIFSKVNPLIKDNSSEIGIIGSACGEVLTEK